MWSFARDGAESSGSLPSWPGPSSFDDLRAVLSTLNGANKPDTIDDDGDDVGDGVEDAADRIRQLQATIKQQEERAVAAKGAMLKRFIDLRASVAVVKKEFSDKVQQIDRVVQSAVLQAAIAPGATTQDEEEEEGRQRRYSTAMLQMQHEQQILLEQIDLLRRMMITKEERKRATVIASPSSEQWEWETARLTMVLSWEAHLHDERACAHLAHDHAANLTNAVEGADRRLVEQRSLLANQRELMEQLRGRWEAAEERERHERAGRVAAERAQRIAENEACRVGATFVEKVARLEGRVRSLLSKVGDQEVDRAEIEEAFELERRRMVAREGKIGELEKRLCAERELIEELQRAQRAQEQMWLKRIEEMRQELSAEKAEWMRARQSSMDAQRDELRHRHELLEAEVNEREAIMRAEHDAETQRCIAQHEDEVRELHIEIADLRQSCDPSVQESMIDAALRQQYLEFDSERQHWAKTKKAWLEEHEQLRSEIITCRGISNQAKKREEDMRAKVDSVTRAIDEMKLSNECRLLEADQKARAQEQARFQEECHRRQTEHQSIVDELKEKLASAHQQANDANSALSERVRMMEGEVEAGRVMYDRALERLQQLQNDTGTQRLQLLAEIDATTKRGEEGMLALKNQAFVERQELTDKWEASVVEIKARLGEEANARLEECRESLAAGKQRLMEEHNERLKQLLVQSDQTLMGLSQRLCREQADLIASERAKHHAELAAIQANAMTMEERAAERRRALEREHQAAITVLEHRIAEIAESVRTREKLVVKVKSEKDEMLLVHSKIEAELLERERRTTVEAEQQRKELIELMELRQAEFVAERERFQQKQLVWRRRLEEAEQRTLEREPRVDDQERIRNLEVQAARQLSACEQMINEVRFYKLEVVNREASYAQRFGEDGQKKPVVPRSLSTSANTTAISAMKGRGPRITTTTTTCNQLRHATSIVDLNTQSGLGGALSIKRTRAPRLQVT